VLSRKASRSGGSVEERLVGVGVGVGACNGCDGWSGTLDCNGTS
jgi:hypothetical protein